MGAAAFGAPDGRADADACLRQHVVELEGFGEIGVEDHRAVGNRKVIAHYGNDIVELLRTFVEQRTGAEHGAVTLHAISPGTIASGLPLSLVTASPCRLVGTPPIL